jgi:hypothetical protein
MFAITNLFLSSRSCSITCFYSNCVCEIIYFDIETQVRRRSQFERHVRQRFFAVSQFLLMRIFFPLFSHRFYSMFFARRDRSSHGSSLCFYASFAEAATVEMYRDFCIRHAILHGVDIAAKDPQLTILNSTTASHQHTEKHKLFYSLPLSAQIPLESNTIPHATTSRARAQIPLYVVPSIVVALHFSRAIKFVDKQTHVASSSTRG